MSGYTEPEDMQPDAGDVIERQREIIAELVEALKDALPYVKAQARFSVDKRAQAIAQECNSALVKAGTQ